MQHLGRLFNALFRSVKRKHSLKEIAALALQLEGATERILEEHKDAGNIKRHYIEIVESANEIFNLCHGYGARNRMLAPPRLEVELEVQYKGSIPYYLDIIRKSLVAIAKELTVELTELKS